MALIELEGVVEEVVFANEENGYTVCIINSDGDPVTLVGIMPYLSEGESIAVQGVWQMHATFGKQLKVEYFEKKLPTTAGAILKYLSSGAIKGIGPVTAERIVTRFGDQALDILENNPDWLAEIKGITLKRALEIGEEYRSQFGVRKVVLELSRFFGPSLSVRIFKRYGSAAVDLFKQNPYRLCNDIAGIGFEKADNAAMELGFAYNCEQRIDAGVLHYLSAAAYSGGHCYLPEERLCDMVCRALNVGREEVFSAFKRLQIDYRLISAEIAGIQVLFLKEYYEAERSIAIRLIRLAEQEQPYANEGIEGHIDSLEKEQGLEYAFEQRRAISLAATSGLTIVTGGPGTGKTTVIKAIIDIFKELKYSFVLAAPTGRAAKRMSEAAGSEAKTIHRLLEVGFNDDRLPNFNRDEQNPLPYKAVIIDEMSMVDTLLMDALLRAVKPGSYLILIGDVDQLPPVGAGNCLADMIGSGRFSVCRLDKIFRQASESMIIVNAHSINSGEMPRLDSKDSDFFFVKRDRAQDICQLLLDLACRRLPVKYKLSALEDIQIISPTRKGPLGTTELNKALQQAFNPQDGRKTTKKYGSIVFRENDKVMQTKNNYDLEWRRPPGTVGERDGKGIFNGDIGKIISIDTRQEQMVIEFDDRVTEYDFSLLDELEHAYAITVHKSQGSEYRFVLMPAFDSPAPLMTRNLLYTAVTRAREMVCIVGRPSCIQEMVSNDKKPLRYSALGHFLREE